MRISQISSPKTWLAQSLKEQSEHNKTKNLEISTCASKTPQNKINKNKIIYIIKNYILKTNTSNTQIKKNIDYLN